jgi:hypothetical protein
MEKTARKPSADPTQERLRQNKANWNKEVSAFINDLIHFKKMMNGWPSKFFKERSRITQPIPADPATIIGSLAGDFQEITNKGNAVIQEQLNYAKNRRQRQPKAPTAPAQPGGAPPATPAAPEAPKPDLTQQLSRQPLAASEELSSLIKLASELETKYELEVVASNPFSRFITRLFTPRIGFGEAARIRQLRMTMLDACVKSYKELKRLHKEIVKSGKGSIENSHKLMTMVTNHWNIVYSLMLSYKAVRPNDVVSDAGGPIEDEDLKKEKAMEEGREPGEGSAPEQAIGNEPAVDKMKDFLSAAAYLGVITKSLAFRELHSAIESVVAAPKNKKLDTLRKVNIDGLYDRALQEVNAELNTSGSSFADIAQQKKSAPVEAKTAQRQLGKLRHQLLPGATSGQRLEIYRTIDQVRKDLNDVMDLLEAGFDQEKLAPAITKVHREISALRTMVRRLYASEKPEQALPFF